ncbi:hypothetical protein KC335_g22 [Hortaea werneckii]|nr:hypothetical protein KC335_g22 [Hortaea werneckii]
MTSNSSEPSALDEVNMSGELDGVRVDDGVGVGFHVVLVVRPGPSRAPFEGVVGYACDCDALAAGAVVLAPEVVVDDVVADCGLAVLGTVAGSRSFVFSASFILDHV